MVYGTLCVTLVFVALWPEMAVQHMNVQGPLLYCGEQDGAARGKSREGKDKQEVVHIELRDTAVTLRQCIETSSTKHKQRY